jgi:proteasome lid subunit RPN8/RPN11
VTLPDGVASAIIEHARETAPHECCGLLIGDDARIAAAVRARNLADEPGRRYLIDPQDHLAAIHLARARKQQVIGAYHSHAHSRAVPSATDTAEAFPNFLFVIVGLGPDPPELLAWTLVDGNFIAVPLVRDP